MSVGISLYHDRAQIDGAEKFRTATTHYISEVSPSLVQKRKRKEEKRREEKNTQKKVSKR